MQKGKMFKKIGAMFFAGVLALVPLSTAVATGNHNMPDPTKAGSITVHKYLRDIDSTIIGTGKELTAAETAVLGTPGAGIKFSLYKVNDSYAVTVGTTVTQALANATLVSTETTDSAGIIKWSWNNNAVGYYILVEDTTTTPEGYTAAPDSIIALPYAVDDENWNYDIHVYPKNVSKKELNKEIANEKPGYSVDDVVDWKYEAQVNLSKIYTNDANGDGTTGDVAYGTYKITDTLDPRLNYTSTTSVVSKGGNTDISLSLPGDYTVDTTTTVGTVVWSLTNAGIQKLADVDATGLEITFKTAVNEKAYGESSAPEIKNGGQLEWKDTKGVEPGGYTIPEKEKPSAKLYNIEIKKTNKDGTKLLDGAVFKIATSQANAKANKFIQYDSNNDGVADKDVTVRTGANPTNAAITGGWALFAGLQVSAAADTTFWLVEDVAPTVGTDKYIRPQLPFEVVIKNSTGATDAEKVNTSVTIKNYLPEDEVPIWELPLTGGMGTVIFYVAGAVVMIGAVLLFLKTKKAKAIL